MACTFNLAIFVAELREDVVSKRGTQSFNSGWDVSASNPAKGEEPE